MPVDYYFNAFNGETGEKIGLLEQSRRELYHTMQRIIFATELKGYPCSSIDWHWQKEKYYSYLESYQENPALYEQLSYEELENSALSYAKGYHSDNDYVAWSGSTDLEKLWEWFEKSSSENELIEEKEDSLTEDIDNLKEELDSNLEYIDPDWQLKKGFKLALKTKGHVTMLFSY